MEIIYLLLLVPTVTKTKKHLLKDLEEGQYFKTSTGATGYILYHSPTSTTVYWTHPGNGEFADELGPKGRMYIAQDTLVRKYNGKKKIRKETNKRDRGKK